MNALGLNEQQLQKMKTQAGLVAALDQSGGSTPKALAAYGIKEGAWSNEDEMFAMVHQMRTRVMTSPSFTGERILGAILFENTMDRDIEGQPTADYLWNVKQVVPFLKVDKGLAEEKDGVRLMKPMPQLAALLNKAKANRIFGTKMRSFINEANPVGIKQIVEQQFAAGAQILAAGLVPILEPEVDIHCPEKVKAEDLLKAAIREKLNKLPAGHLVFLKLTLPEQDDLYAGFVTCPNVVRVLALSGGYSREEANERLRRNHGVVASFSRALLEGLSVQQSDGEFNDVLDTSIHSIFEASTVKQPDRPPERERKAAGPGGAELRTQPPQSSLHNETQKPMLQGAIKIAPSILAADFARLGELVVQAERCGADRIHVDVMDGHFVPNISLGAVIVQSLRKVTRLPLETHMMVTNPDLFLDEFSEAGSDSFLVHWESNPNLHRTVQRIKALGKRAGVVINPATPAAVLEEILSDVDLVLVMTVNPGFGHQHFLRTTLGKIGRVRRMIEQVKPDCDLEVDGGIDEETAPLAVAAGASVLVAGTAVFGGRHGVDAAMKRLQMAANNVIAETRE